MADKARKWTDKKLTRIERRITLIYQQARDEISAEWVTYMERLKKRLKTKQKALDDAIKSGDKEAIVKAKKEYKKALQWGTFRDKKYRTMVEATSANIAHVNEIALAYVNGEIPSVYIHNFNGISEDIKKVVRVYDFTAVNEETVRQLTVLNKTLMLPPKKINIPKDMRWNIKKINNAVLQSILQGESVPKMATRLQEVTNANRKAAIRNARTMVTAAENRGRLAGQERAEQSGIVLQKEWIATADSRTRESHLALDGQTVNTNDYFVDGNGNKLLYPGDYGAPAETVYNCRCSMTTKVIGFRKADGHIDYVDRPDNEDLHDRQIRQERRKRAENA